MIHKPNQPQQPALAIVNPTRWIVTNVDETRQYEFPLNGCYLKQTTTDFTIDLNHHYERSKSIFTFKKEEWKIELK